jgi:vacuolar-type H+-ATPase subunit H
MVKTAIVKGQKLVEEATKSADRLRSLCDTMATVQIDKELKNLQSFGEQVERELQDKERQMETTVLLLAEINSIYQVDCL